MTGTTLTEQHRPADETQQSQVHRIAGEGEWAVTTAEGSLNGSTAVPARLNARSTSSPTPPTIGRNPTDARANVRAEAQIDRAGHVTVGRAHRPHVNRLAETHRSVEAGLLASHDEGTTMVGKKTQPRKARGDTGQDGTDAVPGSPPEAALGVWLSWLKNHHGCVARPGDCRPNLTAMADAARGSDG